MCGCTCWKSRSAENSFAARDSWKKLQSAWVSKTDSRRQQTSQCGEPIFTRFEKKADSQPRVCWAADAVLESNHWRRQQNCNRIFLKIFFAGRDEPFGSFFHIHTRISIWIFFLFIATLLIFLPVLRRFLLLIFIHCACERLIDWPGLYVGYYVKIGFLLALCAFRGKFIRRCDGRREETKRFERWVLFAFHKTHLAITPWSARRIFDFLFCLSGAP